MASENLLAAEEYVAQQKQNAQDPNKRADLTILARKNFYESKRKHAQAQPGRNTERQRRAHQRQKGRNGLAEILPSHFCHRAAHQRANENQRWRRGVGRYRGHQRSAKHRDTK